MNRNFPLTVIAPEQGGRIDIYKRTPQGNIHLVISCCASTGEEARALIQCLQLEIESA